MDRLTGKLESQRHDHRQSPFCEGNGHNWCERKPPRQGTKNHKNSTRAPREWKGWERKQRWAVGKVHRRSACWGMGSHMLAWCREAEKPPNMQRWECNLAAHTMNILLFPSKLRRRITSHTVLAVPSWHTWFYCVHQIVRIARMEAPLLNSSKGSVRSSKFSTTTIASMCRSNKLSKQQTKRTNNKEDVIDSSHNSQKYQVRKHQKQEQPHAFLLINQVITCGKRPGSRPCEAVMITRRHIIPNLFDSLNMFELSWTL